MTNSSSIPWGIAYEQNTTSRNGSVREIAKAQMMQESQETTLLVSRVVEGFKIERHPVHDGLKFASLLEAKLYVDKKIHNAPDRKATAEELARFFTPEELDQLIEDTTGETTATRGVVSKLLKDREMGTEYWSIMNYTSLETFTQSAKKILGDETEIEGRYLAEADWESIYEEFKGMK